MENSKFAGNYGDSDLKRMLELFINNYKYFIFSVFVALGFAFAANYFMTPKYKISSSLLIKDGDNRSYSGGNTTEYLNSRLFQVDRNFQNELWVLKSTPIIEQTVRNLDLDIVYYQKDGLRYREVYKKLPFRVILMYNHIQPVGVRFKLKFTGNNEFAINASGKTVILGEMNTGEVHSVENNWNFQTTGKFGELIKSSDLAFVVQADTVNGRSINPELEYSFLFKDVVTLTEEIKKEVEFKMVDKMATVVEIVYKSASPVKGKAIVNEIMNNYSQQNLDYKNHNAEITISYIERQLDEISDSLKFAEDKLQRFRSSNQVLNFSDQASLIIVQNTELENQLAELETRQRYYDYVADYLEKNDDFSNMIVPASMGISDQLLNNLMSELIAAQSQRSALIQNNQEKNPTVQKLNFQIENLKKTITENISAIRMTTQISIEEKKNRISELQTVMRRLPATQRQLGGIERTYKLNDAIYNYLLEKRAEAKITLASNLPDNLIIEPAKMVGNRPVSPNKKINFLAAFIFGLAVPVGLLTLKGILYNKIDSRETIEAITNAPVIGRILHTSYKKGYTVFGSPRKEVAESFLALRTNLEYHYGAIKKKVILVTSCMEGEGKSFTAFNLAAAYAKLGKRTVLVNCDLRNPASWFGIPADKLPGLSSWYSNHTELTDVIQHSPFDNLDFIQAGPIPENPVELIAQEKTANMIELLKTSYDCIILDTAPLAIVSETFLLMDFASVKIMVVRLGYTNRKVFALTLNDLKTKNIRNINIVLNDNKKIIKQYGYGYGLGYVRKHKKEKNHLAFLLWIKAVKSRLFKFYQSIHFQPVIKRMNGKLTKANVFQRELLKRVVNKKKNKPVAKKNKKQQKNTVK